MTRIDFYILQDSGTAASQLFSCRLAEKVFQQGHEVFINTQSAAQLQQLDELLWTFRAGSFVPHGICNEDEAHQPPVQLGHDTEPGDCHDVLINLCAEVPPFFGRFKRVAELVSGDETQRARGRERYRFYMDRGYTLNTHRIG
jgi:DNA polymerase-3 subunit chi